MLQVPSREVDKTEGKFWSHWNTDTKQFFLQVAFKVERAFQNPSIPRGAGGAEPGPPGTADQSGAGILETE